MTHIQKWQDMGSSHTRSAAQTELAAKSVGDHLNSLPPTTLSIFTEGSALGNPGPCGGAAIIYLHGISNDPVCLNRPVAKRSTSYHGEVEAIDLALEYTANSITPGFNSIMIHSDCRAAMDSILNQSGIFTKLTASIMDKILMLNRCNVGVSFCWVPGHAGIQANELADRHAKIAAEAGNQLPEDHAVPVTVRDAQRILLRELTCVWQR